MRIIQYSDGNCDERLRELFERGTFEPGLERQVASILQRVRSGGDAAVTECARDFDGVALAPADFAVPAAMLEAATSAVASRTRRAIHTACRQVKDFAAQRIPRPWSYSPRKGVILGERFVPLTRVGIYVPGGTAPLVSTVLHTVTLAAAAGVAEIVVTTPPGPDGFVHPALLYAAQYAGATEVLRLGGVYAVAALAFGTETVRRVEKIVGPGNAYVTAAKRQVYGEVAIDLVAGPSELMIIADDSADPRFVAADMLSQAEHGSGREQVVLVTTDPDLLTAVRLELDRQRATLSRADCIAKVLRNGTFLILVEDLEKAADLASRYAPEHLEIMTRRAGNLAKKITAAGAVFLGHWTPESVGDFVAGPSHVLPTGGAARMFSGLSVEHFFRRMSVVNYQKSALLKELDAVTRLAAAEGLDAHGRSAEIRGE